MSSMKTTMGIIGGADGPNAVFVTGESFAEQIDPKMVLLALVIAYFIGCVSPSIMLAKARGIDIKKEGSGNAGTTNALRVMGKKAGVITLVVDIAKGVIAVLLGTVIGGAFAGMCCAVAVFCGHVWPAFYRFKGGKGVATAFGALLGIDPFLGLAALAVVVVGVLFSKRMSVGSILGAASFPLLALWLEPDFIVPGTVMALIVIIKHRANIGRLIRREEPVMSIFEKKKKDGADGDSRESEDRRIHR